MSLDAFPVKANVGELVKVPVAIVGNATVANASIVAGTGQGITLSYSGTGLYTLTASENQGTFVGFTYGLQASTAANIAGHTVVADDYASNALPLQVYNAADAAHALVANEYLYVELWFRRDAV